MEILNVRHLCKTYGTGESSVNALKDASFSMRKSEFAAIVGESGSGKTTLLNLIGGLDDPTSGQVFLSGQELFSMKEQERTIFRRRNIGFIFQSFNLIPELTVEQNIMFPLLLDYQKPNMERVNELLTILGLTDRRNHLPSQLSGGQHQATGKLDSKSSQEVMELLTRAAHHYRQTVLMITHNMGLTAYADRVLRVSDGNLTDLGGNLDEKLS